ncbi:MAG: PAS domain-containing protein, partial [Anaerolineae bacterium]|nr:PAS domain-containing protein [Anaerolineae bacterium]
MGNLLATRVTESEALAKQRGVDLANMEQLNEYIIQHMQTGILVVDGSNVVRLVNDSAWHLLNAPAAIVGRPVRTVSEELAQELESWQEDTDVEPQTFRSSPTSPEIQPRFARLGRDHAAGVLVFLEDTSAMAQQAQQMKLASLGRLTASIAHEIRNPLGAISHASQLLAESGSVEPSSQRMTQIIHQHTQRMNRIIENILQLSRRDRARPELFDLKDWLEEFVQEFARSETVDPEAIAVEISPPDVQVRMDPSQLHQVLWNLCKNGLRHSRAYPRNPQVELRGGMTIESNVPLLDVIDHGEGIAPDVAQQIFD